MKAKIYTGKRLEKAQKREQKFIDRFKKRNQIVIINNIKP